MGETWFSPHEREPEASVVLDEPPPVAEVGEHHADAREREQVADVEGRARRVDVAEGQLPAQVDAVPERHDVGDELEDRERRSIGKNVPENRNMGRIRKRKIATNDCSVCVCAAPRPRSAPRTRAR